MVMAQLEPNTIDCSLIIGIKEPVLVSIESDSINAVVALRAAAFNSSALGNSSRTTLTPGQDAVLRCDVRFFLSTVRSHLRLLVHLAGQVGAQQSGLPSNCLHLDEQNPSAASF